MLKLQEIYKKYRSKDAYAVKEVTLEVSEGEIMALIGESGSGKTTLLRIMAGFEIPDKGTLFLNDICLVSPKTYVKPEHRNIGMVFQDYALFPHLTVLKNITYGLKDLSKKEKIERAEELLHLVGLSDYQDRYPHELSGGQRQRTALARALAPKPAIILLDEPFSNLDVVLKEQVRRDMREIIKQSGATAVFVTHDTKDALATADRIAILKNGEIQQIGTPKVLYEQPINKYVASFFGKTNFLTAKVTPKGYATPIGLIPARTNSVDLNQEVILNIRPENISYCSKDEGMFEASVTEIIYMGEFQQISLNTSKGIKLLTKVDSATTYKLQSTVYVKIKSEEINIIQHQ